MDTQNLYQRSVVHAAQLASQRTVDALAMLDRAQDPRWLRLTRSYQLREAIANIANERRVGVEGEVHAELARTQQTTQQNSFFAPWEVFGRDLTTGVLASGGALVLTDVLPVVAALRANSITAPLGSNIIPAHGNVTIPKVTTPSTALILNGEVQSATESDLTLGQIAMTPRTIGAYVEISRLLLMQSAAEQMVRNDLGLSVGHLVDKLALTGNGVAGEPLGVGNTPGIGTFSGSSLALGGLIDAQASLGNALSAGGVGVASTLAVAALLAKRQKFTGSDSSLWEGLLSAGTTAGMPSRSSTALATGSLFVGCWGFLNIAIWGPGVEISVNPFDRSNFQAGIIGVRAFITFDSAVNFPSAFAMAATVT